jgi:hypothetical protein
MTPTGGPHLSAAEREREGWRALAGLRDKWAGRVGWAGDGRKKRKGKEKRGRGGLGRRWRNWVRELGLFFFLFFQFPFSNQFKTFIKSNLSHNFFQLFSNYF